MHRPSAPPRAGGAGGGSLTRGGFKLRANSSWALPRQGVVHRARACVRTNPLGVAGSARFSDPSPAFGLSGAVAYRPTSSVASGCDRVGRHGCFVGNETSSCASLPLLPHPRLPAP